jgi:hypothetical protein
MCSLLSEVHVQRLEYFVGASRLRALRSMSGRHSYCYLLWFVPIGIAECSEIPLDSFMHQAKHLLRYNMVTTSRNKVFTILMWKCLHLVKRSTHYPSCLNQGSIGPSS